MSEILIGVLRMPPELFWSDDEMTRLQHDNIRREAADEIERLQAECEQLRKDAEFGRSVLAKREPGKSYGCHCDLDEGVEPDACVIDSGGHHYCIYAKDITVKEQCNHWRVIASDAAKIGKAMT